MEKNHPKIGAVRKFFCGTFEVNTKFWLRYFYSITPIVLQSQKIGDQNWSKAVRWHKYDRIRFIAASLHKQASLFDNSAPAP